MPGADWLQYGAFGGLILIVVFIVKQLRDSQQFTQNIAQRSIEATEAQRAAMESIVRDTTQAIEKQTSAMIELSKEIKNRNHQSELNFQKIVVRLGQVGTALEKLQHEK